VSLNILYPAPIRRDSRAKSEREKVERTGLLCLNSALIFLSRAVAHSSGRNVWVDAALKW
jgi:hypothetical protein